MGNFAENLNLGNRVRPPLYVRQDWNTPAIVSVRKDNRKRFWNAAAHVEMTC